MSNKIKYLFLSLVLMPFVGGCASVAEGVTRGLMSDSGEKVDTRSCDVSGYTFKGLEPYMVRQENYSSGDGNPETHPTLKVLMIHGIGNHDTGYSTRLSTNMARELKLDYREPNFKKIDLQHPLVAGDKQLGHVTVTRLIHNKAIPGFHFYYKIW